MKLVKYPDKFLLRKVDDFDFEKSDPISISNKMFDLMEKSGGIGISANQVRVNARVFVMKLSDETHVGSTITVINPEILEVSEEIEIKTEGCLSFPQIYLDIPRPVHIKVKFLDKYAESCIIELHGIDARCFLHEYDHLAGKVFTQYVSRLRLNKARKKGENKW